LAKPFSALPPPLLLPVKSLRLRLDFLLFFVFFFFPCIAQPICEEDRWSLLSTSC